MDICIAPVFGHVYANANSRGHVYWHVHIHFMPMHMSIPVHIIETKGASKLQAELKEARVVTELAWSKGETRW